MAIELQVGGAFHSSLMLPAQEKLAAAIDQTQFQKPAVPVYQNVHGRPVTDPQNISANLKKQLTAPVRWAQTMKNMLADGVDEFIEVGGNGKVLSGFVKRVDRSIPTSSLTELIL
jgi:[acyl-carrier-protein] S-malonyltransferase